jgi:hypothetical protein
VGTGRGLPLALRRVVTATSKKGALVALSCYLVEIQAAIVQMKEVVDIGGHGQVCLGASALRSVHPILLFSNPTSSGRKRGDCAVIRADVTQSHN